MTKVIQSKVLKTESIAWANLEFIQQEDFKEWFPSGDEKLRESLLKFQFVDPFKVWEYEGKLYCLDGRHRYLDLIHIQEQGIDVPDLLPGTFIDCADIKEAAELVLVYSSAYAKITQQGLFDFATKFDIGLETLEGICIDQSINLAMEDLSFPTNFSSELKNNPPTVKIVCENEKQLSHFIRELDKLIDPTLNEKFKGIKYSVSLGEL